MQGRLDQFLRNCPLGILLGKQATVRGYNNYALSADHERRQKALDYVFDGLEKGNLKVAIARDFPFEQYADAHRYLESNEQVGRVVVTV